MEIPKKGWRVDHGDLKQRNEDINERDQPLRKDNQDREDSLGFSLPATPPPITLLKSRDELSCSGGELWRPSNHATVISRWWCHVTLVTVVNHGLIQNCLEILIQIYDRGWLTIAINFSNKSFQKLKLKCSGVAKYCIGNYGGVNTFYKRSKLLKWIKTEKEK